MAPSVSLVGWNEDTDEVFKVALPDEDEIRDAMQKLFNKAFKKELGIMVNAKWVCGIPGKDVAVVWGMTSAKGMHERYLHVSYSDQRTW